jgi:hypothetical protein
MSRGSFMGGAFPFGLAMRALYGAAEAAVQRLNAPCISSRDQLSMQIMPKRRPADAADVLLDEKTREAIREGLTQAERREFVPDDVVKESNKHHGI